MRYRLVDVFSERPLAGNALCVVLDPCPPEVMGPLAREVNLSETTFPTVTEAAGPGMPGRYTNRIFTPTLEMPFAGHPSLGTAFTLGPGRWEQTTAGAVAQLEVDAHGAVMTQPDPAFTEIPTDGLAEAAGLPGVEGAYVSAAGGIHFVLLPTTAPLEAIRPDPRAVAEHVAAHQGVGLCVVRRLDDRTLHVRMFAPGAGVAEDPGTGSAAGPLGVLARRLWGTEADVTVRQGAEVGRPCRIEVHAEEGHVRVGGAVASCAEGRFTLD